MKKLKNCFKNYEKYLDSCLFKKGVWKHLSQPYCYLKEVPCVNGNKAQTCSFTLNRDSGVQILQIKDSWIKLMKGP